MPLQRRDATGDTMTDDYKAAAIRHYRDAELLEDHKRVENADHHFGLAAECGLKEALTQMGGLRREHRKWHIDQLWHKIQAKQFSKSFPKLASLVANRDCFADWKISQRYGSDGEVPRANLERHRKWTARLLGAARIFRG